MKKITLLLAMLVCGFGFSQTFTDANTYDIQNGEGADGPTCGTFDLLLPMDLSAESIGVLGAGANVLENITFSATHTWNADITISLIAPDATEIELMSNAGRGGDNFVDCVLIDGGATLPVVDTNDMTGNYNPVNPLTGFNGIAADGLWTLKVCDAVGGDTGFFGGWSMTFTPAPSCFPPVGTASVADDCGNNQFFIDVDVTSLGTATTVTIANSGGIPFTDVTTTGLVQIGPFPVGFVPVEVQLWHIVPDDFTCDVSLGDSLSGCPPPVPANDDFNMAEAIVCGMTYYSNTTNATLDEDDAPDGFSTDLDGPNVWYAYTDSGSPEEITVDLCASGYDTAYLVYTGTSGNLAIIAANDDNAAICGAGFRSYGTFNTIGDGTTVYYVTINGFNVGSVGPVTATFTCAPILNPPPSNDDCAGADALTFNVTTVGTTIGATASPGEAPTCDLFGAVVDVWYTFTPSADGDYDFNTTATGTSDKASVAVYTSCTATAAESLACTNNLAGGSSVTATLTMGTQYFVKVWNDGNAPRLVASENRRTEGTFDIIVIDTPLSTTDLDANQLFTYFPNPVKNTLTLKAQNEIQNVAVYNMLGQVVLSETPNTVENSLDMSSFQSGAYFVKVTVNNTTETIRVIKN